MDFLNDFLTLEKYAEHHGITTEEAEILFKMGQKYHLQKTNLSLYFEKFEN